MSTVTLRSGDDTAEGYAQSRLQQELDDVYANSITEQVQLIVSQILCGECGEINNRAVLACTTALLKRYTRTLTLQTEVNNRDLCTNVSINFRIKDNT